MIEKLARRTRIKKGLRKRIFGTPDRPRLSIFRSNKGIYAQIIDDQAGRTLVSASLLADKLIIDNMSKSECSKLVGKLIAEKATSVGISKVVFDRNGYLYSGRRVKSLADAAREGGLDF